MEEKPMDILVRQIAGSVHRTVRVEEWTEKNKVRKQAKMKALRLVATDLSSTLFGDREKEKADFIKACGL